MVGSLYFFPQASHHSPRVRKDDGVELIYANARARHELNQQGAKLSVIKPGVKDVLCFMLLPLFCLALSLLHD